MFDPKVAGSNPPSNRKMKKMITKTKQQQKDHKKLNYAYFGGFSLIFYRFTDMEP